jgi:hypothetical protein
MLGRVYRKYTDGTHETDWQNRSLCLKKTSNLNMIPIILLNFKKNVCFNTIHQILSSEMSVQTCNIDLLQNHVH